ncbi:MAG: zinc metalloprotease HtpX [Candidatus Terrybacteria bacterium RIFCSPHIGHO2_01_FULL_48_17]|uniref:Protease HtpX homolog n=1 Tax=Candidatus Terrybacteria bacterium RIFCSPHIGHO2_01_FULL_48_17 TaxID=1802362 RepID=A0A1G2PJS5_9BACT|nr:MAG: zinc metalloprotease HtpX [Candidatus Terrybacteria bacterium RIFCSPHIGHO2_01_FULL_48_17]OHA53612.1 MAG: zinc metalloprotease HtpX [Candidatus Terrybacteria bacterium RIFCSPLOWO2_01_FULL_48_14]
MFTFIVLLGVIGAAFSAYFETPTIFYMVLAFSVLTTFFSYWFSDRVVIALSGAKPIQKQDDPPLWRMIENLSITAGLPMPKVYVVEDPSPNAFATGRDPKHSVIAVTTGLRRMLDESELEGVLAHELSHIGNRDMLVATIAAVLAGIIVTIVHIFVRMTLRGGLGGNRRGNAGAIALVGLIAALILGPLAATLLRLAISRSREFLADASGALLTRYPDGLARALEKIGNARIPMRHRSDAIAHLWLSDPQIEERKTSWFAKMFMTHPPMEERIRALRQQ